MRSTTRILLLVLLALSLSAVFTAAAQEEDDPTILTLPILSDGEPVETTFDTDLDAQLYAFNATEGDVVTITMFQVDDANLDPYIVLMTAAGIVLAADDDSGSNAGGPAFSSIIEEFTLPETGSYFVLATTFSAINAGTVDMDEAEQQEGLEYIIEVSGITQPDTIAEDAFEYFTGSVEVGQEVQITISVEQPIFFVTFMAEKGDVVTLSAAGTDGDNDGSVDLDTLLYLFDFRGNRLAVDDDTGGTAMDGVPLSSLIENFEIPNDGLYLVFATAYNFDEAGEEGWETEGVMDFSIR